jgi:hypothetical protein
MYALILITQLLQPTAITHQVDINYEVIAHYDTLDACLRAKATVMKNDVVVAKHAYECVKVDTN